MFYGVPVWIIPRASESNKRRSPGYEVELRPQLQRSLSLISKNRLKDITAVSCQKLLFHQIKYLI